MNKKVFVLGSRGSALALAQVNLVRALMHKVFPKLEIEIKIIKTTGDKKATASLSSSGIKGLFTKELEQALLLNKIDAAVHSLKDMLTEIPAGLKIGSVLKREDPRDVVVFHPKSNPENLRRIFTSSPRRSLQAKLIWPNVTVQDIRGNVETRLTKLTEGQEGDAILLAAAGLSRLEILSKTEDKYLKFDPALNYKKLSLEEMIPSPGQAAIAIEIRKDDLDAMEFTKPLNHSETYDSVHAERFFLEGMGGGCATPIGAYGRVEGESLTLSSIVGFSEDNIWRGEKTGLRKDYRMIGLELAGECKKCLQIH
jgi:hydroxymethylbilane synthase